MLAAEEDIATIMTMEGGKPLKESKGEFASGYVPRHISLYSTTPWLVLLHCSCYALFTLQVCVIVCQFGARFLMLS